MAAAADRQLDDRAGARAGRGLDPERAAEVEHQPPDDREPEPGPARPWWCRSRRTRGRARRGVMPGPVSVTVTRTCADSAVADAPRCRRSPSPSLRPARLSTALPTRFSRIRRSTSGSAGTGGSAGSGAARSVAWAALGAADDLGDHRVHVARRRLRRGREPGVVPRERVEIRPGSTRASPRRSSKTRGERGRVVARHLGRDGAARSGSAPARS